MSGILVLEQLLNGLGYGLMLFLLAAGLTLVFGIMDMINLAHGSLYMIGAYLAGRGARAHRLLPARRCGRAGRLTALLRHAARMTLLRRLYKRDHLAQVLATFALILICNDRRAHGLGRAPIAERRRPRCPARSSCCRPVLPRLPPADHRRGPGRGGCCCTCWSTRTRIGMRVRAGASNREMADAMGVDIKRLFTGVRLGAALCALAGALLGPLLAVQVGMGESILILAFVVIVIGGIGSIRGALVGALLVGRGGHLGRTLLPAAAAAGAATASDLGPRWRRS
jgi:branched-chain amino acid transport system permease protein